MTTSHSGERAGLMRQHTPQGMRGPTCTRCWCTRPSASRLLTATRSGPASRSLSTMNW